MERWFAMGFFSFFRRKKKDDLPETPESELGGLKEFRESRLPPVPHAHNTGTENFSAKVDLMMAQMDSMRIQYESINERVTQIEKMVKELLDMAKS